MKPIAIGSALASAISASLLAAACDASVGDPTDPSAIAALLQRGG